MTQPQPEVHDADAEGATVERVPSPENPEYDQPTARHFVDRDEVEPDATGFTEEDGEPVPILEAEVGSDRHDYSNSDITGQVGLPGAVATARELYEKDVIEVELPDIDRSGRGGTARVNVDGAAMSDYLEETEEEFGNERNATVGVAVALESAFEAIVQSYDGDAEFDVQDHQRPWSGNSYTGWNRGVMPDDGEYTSEGAYVPELAEAAVDEYRDQTGGKEVLTKIEQENREEEGGLLSSIF